MSRQSERLAQVLELVTLLGDAQVLELHREVSRRATLIRRRDPVYLARLEYGKRMGRPQLAE